MFDGWRVHGWELESKMIHRKWDVFAAHREYDSVDPFDEQFYFLTRQSTYLHFVIETRR